MIQFSNVSKSFGPHTVLGNATFRIHPGDRTGIVGPNGAGKSTILDMICGETVPDAGEVVVSRRASIARLRQELSAHDVPDTLLEYAVNSLPALHDMAREIHAIEKRLAGSVTDARRLMERLGELQTAFEHAGGYDLERSARAALAGLGFGESDFARPFAEFSGGWRMRAELARVMIARPDLLLLDEPTNYLDIPAIEWLRGYLAEFKGTLALVSHDRYLLNALTSVTIEVAGGRATRYPGNYDAYVAGRELRRAQAEAARENQERKREHMERFVERFRAKATKASQAQSRLKMLERLEEVEVPPEPVRRIAMRLADPARSGRDVVRLEGAGVTYDGVRWVLRGVDLLVERGSKIALVGMNGLGKSTLLKLLAGVLPPSAGRRLLGHGVTVGYQSQDFAETLHPEMTVYEIGRAAAPGATESGLRGLLGGFGFCGEEIDKKAGILSGGEKIRLAFAKLLLNPPNFLVLDEPTTHLDIPTREALEDALAAYGGTICLVSHDIEFVRRVADTVVAMTPPGVTLYPGGYDYYREKSAALGAHAAPASTGADGPPGPSANRVARREERKTAEAARRGVRQEYLARKRAVEKRITSAEMRVGELHAEQTDLLARIVAGGDRDHAEVNRRLAEIQEETRRAEREWEEAAGELESMENPAAP